MGPQPEDAGVVDVDAYCREIEAHLCRRNAGHLVRVTGPAFEMVAGWAAKGIPLKVALGGIDRAVERRDAKGPGRRPLRVEFCEPDVLDGFDAWRRAVGVGTAGGGGAVQAKEILASPGLICRLKGSLGVVTGRALSSLDLVPSPIALTALIL